MRDLLRKWFLPWTAEYLFSDDRQYQKWLQRRYASMRTARILCLLVAAVCLLVGAGAAEWSSSSGGKVAQQRMEVMATRGRRKGEVETHMRGRGISRGWGSGIGLGRA